MKKYLIAGLLIGTMFVSACCCQKHKKDEAITFGLDSYALTSHDKVELDKIAKDMKNDKSAKVKVYGHTDTTGSREHNLKLSKERAQAAAKYLEADGVASKRITVIAGEGEHFPATTNKTKGGRKQNRRVKLELY